VDVNDKISFEGSQNGIRSYTVENSKSIISKAGISFMEATGFIHKVTIEYSPKAGMGIAKTITEFTYDNFDPHFSTDLFDEGRFVITKNNTYYPAVAYKGFEIITIQAPSHLNSNVN
jgi:hypothetical protein